MLIHVGLKSDLQTTTVRLTKSPGAIFNSEAGPQGQRAGGPV
jgi:hypothetical protein